MATPLTFSYPIYGSCAPATFCWRTPSLTLPYSLENLHRTPYPSSITVLLRYYFTRSNKWIQFYHPFSSNTWAFTSPSTSITHHRVRSGFQRLAGATAQPSSSLHVTINNEAKPEAVAVFVGPGC
eukprot:scaffold5357_cov208-Amphora_coffeaeformis.AAC.28